MDIVATLSAAPRTETGKGPARRARVKGMVPVVFYGRGRDTLPLMVNTKELHAILLSHGMSSLLTLKIEQDGAASESVVMVKDYQVDPVKRNLLHADFYEINVNEAIQIDVPLILTGKPIGLERGGILQQLRRELTVSALPMNVPEKIEVDVSGIDLGHSLHIEDVPAPEGVKFVYDTNFTLAAVVASKGMAITTEALPEEGAEGAAEAEKK